MNNKKVLSKAVSELDKAKAPAKPKDIITDPMGQWKYPGQNTRIPGGDITMQGVNYPVWAQPSVGPGVMMQPGQDYNFPDAEYVDEYPQMKKGGKKPSKKYTRNITAMNKFFAVNPLFKKPKKKQIYDPNASFYQDGGQAQDYIELELTPEEIQAYKDGGYVVEELDDYKQGGALLTKKVTCKKCGWEWNAADGGKDITTCHKCGGEGLIHAEKGGVLGCPPGLRKDEFGNCIPITTNKEVIVKTPRVNPITKKLNYLRKKLEKYDSQNDGLGPTKMSDMSERGRIYEQIVELEAKHKDKLKNTPRIDQMEAIGNTMLTVGKYFMPGAVKTGINYLLNASDAYDYAQDPNNESNKLSVASDILSPLKSSKTKVAPFSVMSDVINLKQQYDKFEKAKKQHYEKGGAYYDDSRDAWVSADGTVGPNGPAYANGGSTMNDISVPSLNQ
jgi:predicted Zn-ribbon and HTH transcriptional regulator